MNENAQQQEGQKQGGDSAKVLKTFNENKAKALALLGGGAEVLFERKGKASSDQIDEAVKKLLKKKTEGFLEKVEKELDTLINLQITTEDEIEKKEKELANLKTQAMKKFNEEFGKIMNSIGAHQTLQERYKATLSGHISDPSGEDNAEEKGSSSDQ